MSAIHFTSYHTFGVLYRNLTLRISHPYNKRNDKNKDNDDERRPEIVNCISGRIADRGLNQADNKHNCRRSTGYNTRKQDDGDTVSDTFNINLFTQPNNQRCTGCKHQHNNNCREPSGKTGGISDTALGFQGEIQAECLYQSQSQCSPTGNLVEFLSAFFSFFRHSLQRRNRNRQKLNDDRSVNIRGDRHGKECCIGESATGDNIQITQKATCFFYHAL